MATTMQTALKTVVGFFDNENLSLWAKENDKLEFSSRARMLNALLSGLTFAIKSQSQYISGVQTKIKEACESSNTTDTHEAYITGLMDNITQNDVTETEFADIILALKDEYKEATGSAWVPYVKQDAKQLGKNLATASRLEAMAMLKKKGVKIDNPALQEVLDDNEATQNAIKDGLIDA